MSWDIDVTLCRTWADELIQRHNPKRFEQPCAVDVYDLIDIVGAKLAIEYLTPQGKYLGATIFKDTALLVWPGYPYYNGMMPSWKFFKKDTIIIDRALAESVDETNVKIANFTFLHEIFHFENHGSKIVENYHITQNEKKEGCKLEQEANFGASLFLMPENAIKNVFLEQFRMSKLPESPLPYGNKTKPLIQQMAKIFDVNFTPMLYRLRELNLIGRYWQREWNYI